MGRRRVPEEDRQLIEHIYAEDPARTGKEVLAQFGQRSGKNLSARKIYEIIQPLRGKLAPATEEPLWNSASAWGETGSEDMAFLLTLDLIFLVYEGVHLTQREARWGANLRHFLEGEYPLLQMALVRAYGARERAAEALGTEPPYAADLDALLQWRPWRSEKLAHLYRVAAEVGIIPALPPWEQMAEQIKTAYPASYLGDGLALLLGMESTGGEHIPPEIERALERVEAPVEVRAFGDAMQALRDDFSKIEVCIRFHALTATSKFNGMSHQERVQAVRELMEQMTESNERPAVGSV